MLKSNMIRLALNIFKMQQGRDLKDPRIDMMASAKFERKELPFFQIYMKQH